MRLQVVREGWFVLLLAEVNMSLKRGVAIDQR